MENLLATKSVSITELKRSPSAVIEQANFEPVAVLNHNKPAAYLIAPDIYQTLIARFESSEIKAAITASRLDTRPVVKAEDVFSALESMVKKTSLNQTG